MRVALVPVVLLLAEGLIRLTGLGPWTPFSTFQDLPTMSDPDPELGWVNRAGHYSYTVAHHPIEVRLEPHRTTSSTGTIPVEFFGGSFVFGFGLGDADTFPAQLASTRPDLHIRNHAVPGYGTLQSKGLHARVGEPGATVVYGLVDLHDARNAGALTWLHALERSSRGQAWIATPSVWWDGTRLHHEPPTSYTHWPWSERSGIVHRIELAWLSTVDRLKRTKAETTMQLLADWDQQVDGRFVVALLHAPQRERYYTKRLEELGLEWIDLRHPRYPEWSIDGDGHPDARVQTDWAQGLADLL